MINQGMTTLTHEVYINWPTAPVYQSSCPNEEFRTWLEEHAGHQHKDWDWDLVGIEGIMVSFREVEAAILFKLTFSG